MYGLQIHTGRTYTMGKERVKISCPQIKQKGGYGWFSGDVFMHTSPPDKTVCLHSYVIGVQHKIIKVLNKIAWNVGDGNTLQDV